MEAEVWFRPPVERPYTRLVEGHYPVLEEQQPELVPDQSAWPRELIK